MSLIPGFIRDDDSTEAGGANLGIRGNRAYYSSNLVFVQFMNPFSAREFGYGACTTICKLLLLVLLDRIMQILMLLKTAQMLVTTAACWGFDGDGNKLC